MSNNTNELIAITDNNVVVVRQYGHVGHVAYDDVVLLCPFGRAEESAWWRYHANIEQLVDGWRGVAEALGFRNEDEFWDWANQS